MKNYKEIKDEILDMTMSMDIDEAVKCLENIVRSNTFLANTFCNAEARLEAQAAQEILDSLKRG